VRRQPASEGTVGEGFIPSRIPSKSQQIVRAGIKPAPTTDQKYALSGWTLIDPWLRWLKRRCL
jgi:hypothetical protein